jgi:hypothetical protein
MSFLASITYVLIILSYKIQSVLSRPVLMLRRKPEGN